MDMDYFKLETLTDVLSFDRASLRLISFVSKVASDQQFIDYLPEHPAFDIGYYDAKRRYRLIGSLSSQSVEVTEKFGKLTGYYKGVGGFNLDVICTIQANINDRYTKWNITVINNEGLDIIDVQYPYVICRYEMDGTPNTESIVLPHGYGSGHVISGGLRFHPNAERHRLVADDWKRWELHERNGNCNHYPGMQYAQFLAYHNDRAGLYIACNDTEANIKRFEALHREPGFRLGVAHVGDWPKQGTRTLEYDILMTSFTGDWYDAADLYREWSFNQKWFIPLYKKNIPQWLADSPVYLTVRPAGILDMSYEMVEEFLPLKEKVIPLLESVAEKLQASLAVILMGWERAGSWVSPDSFPPVGGEEGMKEFITALREHGWQGGTFSNGTRYIFEQCWSRYDGRDYLDAIGAEEGVAKEADGSLHLENWENFRSAYLACIGSKKGRQTSIDFVEHLISWGMESLQYLDQNNGGSVFPCFATDHDHPPMPGKWMHEKLQELMQGFEEAEKRQGMGTVVHSAESGLNEMCLPMFHQTELRIFPENYGTDVVPMYQYLFHECIALQGMMGNAPEPYHLALRNAANCVLGGMPGGVLTGDGTLLDKNTNNWALWEPHVENSEQAFEMIRTVAALRRGVGKDYLLYGRMLRPAMVPGIPMINWTFNGRSNSIPSVFHNVWQTPTGQIGVVLSNWTSVTQKVRIMDERLAVLHRPLQITISERTMCTEIANYGEGGLMLELPPFSCALVH